MTLERVVQVAQRRVGPGEPVFVIAEIGASHGGDPAVALRLVEEAARSGVDAVKLQTIRADESYVAGEASHRIFSGLWLEKPALLEIQAACRERGIVLFSTPGDYPSLELLVEIGVPLLKISSGLMTNLPLVRRAAATGIPLVISTGMSHLDEVRATVSAAAAAGARELLLMHCVSLYPAPAESLNLLAMAALASEFVCPVGYSDHYDGPEACLAAVALGARLLEKHFTLDRGRGGPDDPFSAEPEEMRRLVGSVREVERMGGSGAKAPAAAEVPGRERWRRCLVARRAIAAGEVLSEESVGLKRPRAGCQGIPPDRLESVLGRRAARTIEKDESISWEMVSDG